MAHEFKKRIILLQGLAAGDSISAKVLLSEGAFVLIKSSDDDILLFVGVNPDSNQFALNSRIDGKWQGKKTGLLKERDRDIVDLRMEFAETHVRVGVGEAEAIDFPFTRAFTNAIRLEGDLKLSEPEVRWSDTATYEAQRRLVTKIDVAPEASKATAPVQHDLIYDLGMHIGQDTDFYLKKGFRVIAVEASPVLARQGARKFAQAIDDGRLIILNLGVSDRRGCFPFYINTVLDHWSSFVKAIAAREHPVEEVEINAVLVQDLFAVYGVPYYLKVDIEGSDRHVISQLPGLDNLPTYVSFENAAPDVFDMIVRAGYQVFKFVNQSDVGNVALPSPSSEGRTIDYKFEYGASGPFGADLGPDWLDPAAMLKRLQQHWATGSEEGAWYDLHASLVRIGSPSG